VYPSRCTCSGLLLGLVYALAALLTLVPALMDRGRDDQDAADAPEVVDPPVRVLTGAAA